jgi:hypothetical protein
MLLEFIFDFLQFLIGIALGGYILFVGRQAIQITLGIIALVAMADLLAVLVAGQADGWDLIAAQAWWLLGIAVVVGILGFLLGQTKPDTAVLVIGFVAGADLALWFYQISAHFLTKVVQQSEQTALFMGLIVLLIGGLLGLWLVRVSKDEALILITIIMGTKMIHIALGLGTTSSWTAIITLTFALAGVLVQYAIYLREVKGEQTTIEPHSSSVAYFQDLDFHL